MDFNLVSFEMFVHSRDDLTADSGILTADSGILTADTGVRRTPFLTTPSTDFFLPHHPSKERLLSNQFLNVFFFFCRCFFFVF